MQAIKEHQRRPSPGARPQPLAFFKTSLWIGSWGTKHVYETDPQTGRVIQDIPAPGTPYGLAVSGGELRAVVSDDGEADDRYLYRIQASGGFDSSSKVACPDLTGSHLAADGDVLYLAQMHSRRLLVIGPDGATQRAIALPSRIGGMGFRDGTLYVIATDEEFENLRFATLDVSSEQGKIAEIGVIPFDARSLAFDGTAWWTCHREASEIVSFTV